MKTQQLENNINSEVIITIINIISIIRMLKSAANAMRFMERLSIITQPYMSMLFAPISYMTHFLGQSWPSW